MNRYDAGAEGEYEPGSRGRVLRHKLGIRSQRQMDDVEFEKLLVAQREYTFKVRRDTLFTSEFICEMHRDWLGSVYPWAVRYRTVNVSKPGFTWPPAVFVEQNMRQFEGETLRRLTPCHLTDARALSLALSEIQAELLFVHPFREGNGRTSRWLTDLIAGQAGFAILHYGFEGKGAPSRQREYLEGVKAGYIKSYDRLARFLEAAILRGLEGADLGA